MASAVERLKAFARAAVAPLTSFERRVLVETGLPVVWNTKPDPIHVALSDRLMPLAAYDDYPALARAFDRLFDEKSFCGNGYRCYRVAHELLLARIEATFATGDPTYAEAALVPYERWWAQDKTDPAAAAIYARALTVTGYAFRGAGWANEVDEAAWDTLKGYCDRARSVLAGVTPTRRRHWLWRQADFSLTFIAWGCDAADEDMLLPSFAAVQTLDPLEFGIYDDRTVHLLPRWAGSYGAVDAFARASADRTAARFGELMYARVYDSVLGYEDAERTCVDHERLLGGFADWHDRFPGQPLANRFAAYAHAFGDHATVEQLFRGAIREIHPAHWFHQDQALEAWRSVAPTQGTGRAG